MGGGAVTEEKVNLFWSSHVGTELFFHRNVIIYDIHTTLLLAHYGLSSFG